MIDYYETKEHPITKKMVLGNLQTIDYRNVKDATDLC